MSTELVTGSLLDFAEVPLYAVAGELVFKPSGPGTSGDTIFSTKPIRVTPTSSGTFSVRLHRTDTIIPTVWYDLEIHWLNAAGEVFGADYLPWKITVPAGGGFIGDLVQSTSNPQLVWIGLTAPTNPSRYQLWLEQNPNDIADPLNTANLYQWS